MKLLACWVGEFGHELFCFQGRIRHMAKKHYKHVTILTRKGHGELYKDFSNDIVEIEVKGETEGCLCRNIEIDKENAQIINDLKNEDFDNIIKPQKQVMDYNPLHPGMAERWTKIEQDFVKYGDGSGDYDWLIHARDTNKCKTESRNWQRKKWEGLIPNLKGKIATIGTLDASMSFKGIEDLRGEPLNELVNVISGSKCVIGPSSGTMHLASLCGTDQIVWSTEQNRKRYMNHWNPFKTKVVFINKGGFDPDIKDIIDGITRYKQK